MPKSLDVCVDEMLLKAHGRIDAETGRPLDLSAEYDAFNEALDAVMDHLAAANSALEHWPDEKRIQHLELVASLYRALCIRVLDEAAAAESLLPAPLKSELFNLRALVEIEGMAG